MEEHRSTLTILTPLIETPDPSTHAPQPSKQMFENTSWNPRTLLPEKKALSPMTFFVGILPDNLPGPNFAEVPTLLVEGPYYIFW